MGRTLLALAFAVLTLADAGAAQSRGVSGTMLGDANARFIEMPGGDADARFRSVASDHAIVYGDSGPSIRLSGAGSAAKAAGSTALRYQFLGSQHATPEGLKASSTRYNWMVGSPDAWAIGMKSYGQIAYRGVWSGIDALYSGDAEAIKYHFEVAAGADPKSIGFVVRGAKSARIAADGALEWDLGARVLRDDPPIAYQYSGNVETTIPVSYRLRDLGDGSWQLTFDVASYDDGKALIVDPAWTGFAGLVGGSAADQVRAIARDGSGNSYACGDSNGDAFIAKFNAAGASQFVTYFGGSGLDLCTGVALGPLGAIYLTGGTTSTNFPFAGTDAAGRLRRTKAGSDRDAFVTVYAANGSTLQYSGVMGGAADDQANGIAVDGTGRAFITGFTASATFPVVGVSAPLTTFSGGGVFGNDAFVARIAADGSGVEYSGFLGGNGGVDLGNAIALASDGSAVVAGETDSTAGLPSMAGTLRSSVGDRANGDIADAFVARVSSGGALSFFTILTGSPPGLAPGARSGIDRALAVAVEADGTIVVSGETDSDAFPANDANVRIGAGPQASSGGGMDGFVVRLASDAATVSGATYLGGTGYDAAEGLALDGAGNVFATGTTTPGSGFPLAATSGLAQVRPGAQDAFLTKMQAAAALPFVYSGFLGSAGFDALHAVAAAADGIVFLGGASSADGTPPNGVVYRINPYGAPATTTVVSGSNQSAQIGSAFAAKLRVLVKDADGVAVPGAIVTYTPPGSGATATLSPSASIATDASGFAEVTATAAAARGAYTVTATAAPGTPAIFNLTNVGFPASVVVTTGTPSVPFGASVTLTATVTGSSPTGSVTFKDGATTLCNAVALSGVVATCTSSALSVAAHSITAVYSGDAANEVGTSPVLTVTVTQASQAITFAALVDKVFGDAPFTVSATSSSLLTVTFSTLTTSVCTVAGTTVTIVATGLCTIDADQAGDTNYLAAPRVSRSFNVGKKSQTITFGALGGKTFGDAPFTVAATSSSALAVTFTAAPPTVCTVLANTVTIVGAGQCTITAAQAGDANYSAATPVPQSFTVVQATQTINFGPLGGKTFGDAPFTVAATATSTLAVTFGAAPAGVCTMVGNTVTLVGAGLCTVTANQAGNANYLAATPVPQSFNVAKAAQTITFAPLADRVLGTAPFSVAATASSGLAVTFSTLSTACTVVGNTVTLVTAGSCSVTASQAGNANYLAATPVSQGFTITKAPQAITFNALPGKTFGDAPFAVSASASSGLAVTFTSLTPACTVAGSTVTIVDTGPCTIAADQGGNATFLPALQVTQSFAIARASVAMGIARTAGVTPSVPGDSLTFTVTLPAVNGVFPVGSVTFVDGAITLGTVALSGGSAAFTTTALAPGSHNIAAAYAGDTRFNAVNSGTVSQVVQLSSIVDTDGDGIPDAIDFAEGLNPNVKDNDVFTKARLFVMQQYRDFLGREGDVGGIKYWTDQIDVYQRPRTEVIENFYASPEFAARYAPVARLYFAYFQRVPDMAGLDFWTAQLQAGLPLASISNAFASSGEFTARYGTLDNTQFVSRVYANLLGRLPDPGGLTYWLGQLNSGGITRGQMVLAFSESAEFGAAIANEVAVTLIYRGMLRRMPEPGGFTYWVSLLDSGVSARSMISALLGSGEYRARFLP